MPKKAPSAFDLVAFASVWRRYRHAWCYCQCVPRALQLTVNWVGVRLVPVELGSDQNIFASFYEASDGSPRPGEANRRRVQARGVHSYRATCDHQPASQPFSLLPPFPKAPNYSLQPEKSISRAIHTSATDPPSLYFSTARTRHYVAMPALLIHFKRLAVSFLVVTALSLFIALDYRDSLVAILHSSSSSSVDAHISPFPEPKTTIREPCIGPRGTYVEEQHDRKSQAVSLTLRRCFPIDFVHIYRQI